MRAVKWSGILRVLTVFATVFCARLLVFAADEPTPIEIVPSDGFNLKIEEQLPNNYVIVSLQTPVHNWFAATISNLPINQEVTIGLSMEGTDTKGNQGSVAKWAGTPGLIPVMTYADPTTYEAYEWYEKDAKGRWVSGDLFKTGNARFAGTGKVPEQTAIPKEAAEQFLSTDGYWQPWREVDAAEAVVPLNIFRMKQKFAASTATVAMRVPFTYTYQQLWLEKLKAAKLPGVCIDECGKTPQGRLLQVVRVEDPNLPPPVSRIAR